MIQKRSIIQIFFFVVSILVFVGIIKKVLLDVHAFCPYSIVCFGFDHFSWYIYPIMMIVGILILISTMFLSRWFCNYICYFGILQEWLYNLFHLKNKKRFKFTMKIDNLLKKVKFIILLMTVIMSFIGVSKYMRFCPHNIIASIGNYLEKIGDVGLISFVFLFILLVLSVLIERFWCRYLCPYAALMIIFIKMADLLKIKRLKIHRNLETCIDCYKCNNNCPMQVNLLDSEYVQDAECLQCNRCQNVCPKTGTLTKKWR